MADAPEFAVADAVIALSTSRIGDRESRTLRVLKLRGSALVLGRARLPDHLGRHRGLPAPRRPVEIDEYVLSGVRISSGIAALDELLADGYWPGASTLCAGPSGSGKTLMGLHFIFNGAAPETRGHRHAAGEPDPARADPRRLRLGARGARGRAHVPLAGRPLHRRVGLRPARHRGTRRRPARADRQPLRPAVRRARPGPLPRVHLLAQPAAVAARASASS